jgi:hypothetical protein
MASKDIVLLKFETKEIRCINIGDDAWFALTDVLAGMKSSTKLTDAKASVIEAFGKGRLFYDLTTELDETIHAYFR